MAGFLKKALLSVVMDKKARDKAARRAAARKTAMPDKPAPRPMTPEREALIRQAQEIRRSKAHILDELPAETRGKLFAMAFLSMGGESLSADEIADADERKEKDGEP